MLSRFFIDRPIFAAVISLFLVLAGLAAMRSLPIAQYPEIAPPVVTVQAVYPGASAQTIEQTVASPIENAINGVPGMIYMSSSSGSNGVLQIQVTFDIGTNVDIASVNVNNRVNEVLPRLPEEVRRQGVTVQRGSSAFLQVLAFYSPDGRYNDLFTSNYVTLNVLDQLKRLPGTTNVQIFGAHDYAMRIWLKPDRMAQLRLTPSDVIAAVNEQNAQFAAGKVGQSPSPNNQALVYTVTTRGRLTDPKEFEQIIVRANPDGSTVRLVDVARVELGSKDYEFIGRFNGRDATLVGIFLSPGANALDVAKTVRTEVASLAARFPEGLSYAVPYDTTRFVEVSIREVLKTLGEAMLLVFLVIYLFLQSWRAAIIPFAAVPVALIGAFAGIYALGYSINTLTLFAMVLSIGIVVDDAIVVLENVERHMREDHLAPRDAALKAMREVTGPIIAIVLTLTAVFVPIAFLGGLTGELYRQFAVTIAMSVVISGLVALTLSPALCALILKPHEPPNRFFAWFNRWFGRVTARYSDGVVWMLRRGVIGTILFLGMVALTAWLWRHTPSSLVPDEDQGFYISAVILPDGATLERTDQVVTEVAKAIRSNPNNQDIIAFTGFDFIGGGFRNNAATIFVTQKHWDERTVTAPQLVGELYGKTAGIKEALVLAFNPPPIFGLGTAGGFEFYIQNRGDGGAKRLSEVTQAFLARANRDPVLAGAQTLWRAIVPQSSGRHRRRLCPLVEGRNDSAVVGRDGSLFVGAGRARSLQQPAGGQGHRTGCAGVQLRPGDRGSRKDRGRSVAGRLQLRLGRHVVSGKEVERRGDVLARPRGRDGVPDPGRAIRTLVAPAVGAPRAAVRHVRRVGSDLAARTQQRRVLPDRSRDAARARGKKRDPDRRIRGAENARRHVAVGGGDRGRAPALPADPDDVARVHSRRDPARDFDRRGRRGPAF